MDRIDDKPRCFGSHSALYADYHDKEWGVPVHDDRTLFEMLILEGAHAGLSWETVLKKREGYRARFWNFDVARVAAMTEDEIAAALADPGIVRHRQKIASTRKNAAAVLEIQREFGTFDAYLWGWVGGAPRLNRPSGFTEIPATSPVSDALSKDLRKRGMGFVGSTIVYSLMQAIGMVNDHHAGCWRFGQDLGR